MAVSSTIVWEFRATGTANMVNGGGFKPGASGTDWSQQDAAQYNLTSATTAAANAIILHASAAADMVGNICHIISGTNFTAGWYEIISVVAGVSITVDRNCTSAAGSAGVVNIGGALNFGSATLDTAWFSATAGGNMIWVKNGSYTFGAAVTAGTAGGTQNPTMMKGYNTTRGDNPTGSSRPTIIQGANGWALGAHWQVYNFIITCTGSTGFVANNVNFIVGNVKVTNTSTTAGRAAMTLGTSSFFAFNCEMISYRGIAVNLTSGASNGVLYGNYIHDSNVGISFSGGNISCDFIGNIISDHVSTAILMGSAQTSYCLISGNTLYGAENKLGTGISFTTGTTDVMRVFNNIIYGFVTGVTHPDAGELGSYDDFNNYFNNTTDNTNWTKGGNDIALNPNFTNVAQYTGTAATTSGSVLTDGTAAFTNVVDNVSFCYIKSGTGVTVGKYKITGHSATTLTLDIAPGTSAVADKVYQVTTGLDFSVGANMDSVGFPGAFQAGLTTGKLDIGAVQRKKVSTDPGVTKVKTGTTYTINDSALTGTEVNTDPGVANVRSGTTYTINNASLTGTYLNTDPGIANVKSGVNYTINSVSLTGTYSASGTGGSYCFLT